MSQSQVELIIERWMQDENFRQRLRVDPLTTVQSEGFVLSEEEQAGLLRMDFSVPDDELASQANFAG
ncbi:MAG TPA: Os1348 family NHLP clan protein [Hymenobacter sp.]|jgi:hypothetical protein